MMVPKVFACKNKDLNIRIDSTSGGVFTLFAEMVLKKNGVVYGVVFDQNFNVKFARAETLDEIKGMRGSKYPQADLGNVFCSVKTDLECGKNVLFVGTPCQVQGLKAYLGTCPAGLVSLDFICLGVGSPGVWKRYLFENYKVERIEDIRFKDKRDGWHRFSTVIKTKDTEIVTPGSLNAYMSSYLSGCNVRPSCYSCRFKNIKGRVSDITISDCWGIEHIASDFDDDKGISNVFINTDRGADLFDSVRSELDYMEIPFDDAIRYNLYYTELIKVDGLREKFWKIYREKGFTDASRAIMPRLKLWQKVKKFIRRWKSIAV